MLISIKIDRTEFLVLGCFPAEFSGVFYSITADFPKLS